MLIGCGRCPCSLFLTPSFRSVLPLCPLIRSHSMLRRAGCCSGCDTKHLRSKCRFASERVGGHSAAPLLLRLRPPPTAGAAALAPPPPPPLCCARGGAKGAGGGGAARLIGAGAEGSWWQGERWHPSGCSLLRFEEEGEAAAADIGDRAAAAAIAASPPMPRTLGDCLRGRHMRGGLVLLLGDSNTRAAFFALQRALRGHEAFGPGCYGRHDRVGGLARGLAARPARTRGSAGGGGGRESAMAPTTEDLVAVALGAGMGMPAGDLELGCVRMFERWLIPRAPLAPFRGSSDSSGVSGGNAASENGGGSHCAGGPVFAQLEGDLRDPVLARCIVALRPAAVVAGLRLAALWDFSPGWDGPSGGVTAELRAARALAASLPPATALVLQSNTALHAQRHWHGHMGISDPRAARLAARLAATLPSFPPNVAFFDAYNSSLARADLASDGIHFGSAYSLNAIETVLNLACRCN